MIRIVNCFKIEPELDKVTNEEWAEAAQNGQIDLSFLKSRINLQDEGALELALKFKDAAAGAGEECQLSAISAGSKTVNNTLQTLAALGYTSTDRIVWGEEFSPVRTARVIADAILDKEEQDMIICGGQSGTGSNRSVPLLISDMLGIPCITGVTEFTYVSDKEVKVTYSRDDMEVTEIVSMPLVMAIGDVQKAFLRVPTLMQRMASMSQPVGEINPECNAREGATLKGFRYLDQSRNGELIDGSNPVDAAQIILDRLKEEGVVK